MKRVIEKKKRNKNHHLWSGHKLDIRFTDGEANRSTDKPENASEWMLHTYAQSCYNLCLQVGVAYNQQVIKYS